MTRRKEKEPIQKVTLNLYDGDFARLREFYGTISAAKVVRLLVRNHIQRLQNNMEEKLKKVEEIE